MSRVGTDRDLGPGTLAAVGALEIAIHGWDVACSCGADRPLPDGLAVALLGVALDLLPDADRPGRFAPPLPSDPGDPTGRLLGSLGRRA